MPNKIYDVDGDGSVFVGDIRYLTSNGIKCRFDFDIHRLPRWRKSAPHFRTLPSSRHGGDPESMCGPIGHLRLSLRFPSGVIRRQVFVYEEEDCKSLNRHYRAAPVRSSQDSWGVTYSEARDKPLRLDAGRICRLGHAALGLDSNTNQYKRLQICREFRRRKDGKVFEVNTYCRDQLNSIRKFIDDESLRLNDDSRLGTVEVSKAAKKCVATILRDIRRGVLKPQTGTCVRRGTQAYRFEQDVVTEYVGRVEAKGDDEVPWWEIPSHVKGSEHSWIESLVERRAISCALRMVTRSDGKQFPANCVPTKEFPTIVELLGKHAPPEFVSLRYALQILRRNQVIGKTASHRDWLSSGTWPTLVDKFPVERFRVDDSVGRTVLVNHVQRSVVDQIVSIERMWIRTGWLEDVLGCSTGVAYQWATQRRKCSYLGRFLVDNEVRVLPTLRRGPAGPRIHAPTCREILLLASVNSTLTRDRRRLSSVAGSLKRTVSKWTSLAETTLRGDSRPHVEVLSRGDELTMPGVASVKLIDDLGLDEEYDGTVRQTFNAQASQEYHAQVNQVAHGPVIIQQIVSEPSDSKHWMRGIHRRIISAIGSYKRPTDKPNKRGPSGTELARMLGDNLSDRSGALSDAIRDLKNHGIVNNQGSGPGATGYFLVKESEVPEISAK